MSYRRMYHDRALGLLPPEERTLIQGFFDQDGKQVTSITSLKAGPARRAYARYGRAMEDVIKHIRKRKTETEYFCISVPVFIWLQPDLSFMEKHLLADVWGLQKRPLGCFKSNAGFALELGTTEGNVADMIYRLRRASFLDEHKGKKGERVLRLSKAFLELVGQSPLMDSSVPTDDEFSAHLPSRQSPLTNASVGTDEEQEQDRDETRMDIDDSAEADAPNLQGDIRINQQQPQAEARQAVVVAGKTKTGASAPEPPPRGFAPSTPTTQPKQKQEPGAKSKQAGQTSSPATGAPRRAAVQKPAGNTAEAADASGREAGAAGGQSDAVDADTSRFLGFFQIAHKSKFGTSARPTETDRQAVRNLIRQDNWAIPDLVLILLRAWDLIGAISEDNGYAYPCCQHSQKIGKFVQHFDRICSDTGSNNIRDLPVGEVIAKIMRLTEVDPDEIERFFTPESEQEDAAEAEPEMRLEDMPDPGQTGVGLKAYVRTTPNIPFEWIEQKLIPHLAEPYGQLPAGKLEFLFGYWKLCKRYQHHFSHDIAYDYSEARNHKSDRFKDEGVRAKLLTIVEGMFKQYRRWEQTGTGERPLWPILSNVLSDERIRKLLQDGESQEPANREPH